MAQTGTKDNSIGIHFLDGGARFRQSLHGSLSKPARDRELFRVRPQRKRFNGVAAQPVSGAVRGLFLHVPKTDIRIIVPRSIKMPDISGQENRIAVVILRHRALFASMNAFSFRRSSASIHRAV